MSSFALKQAILFTASSFYNYVKRLKWVEMSAYILGPIDPCSFDIIVDIFTMILNEEMVLVPAVTSTKTRREGAWPYCSFPEGVFQVVRYLLVSPKQSDNIEKAS